MLISYIHSATQIKATNLNLCTSRVAGRAWQHLPKTCHVPGFDIFFQRVFSAQLAVCKQISQQKAKSCQAEQQDTLIIAVSTFTSPERDVSHPSITCSNRTGEQQHG